MEATFNKYMMLSMMNLDISILEQVLRLQQPVCSPVEPRPVAVLVPTAIVA